MSEAAKRVVDWERIELDYRAGVLSIREIADQNGISDAAIRQYAKGTKTREKWTRDLSAKVKAKTEDLLRTDLLRTTLRAETASEREVVDATATAIASIELSHRADVRGYRDLAASLAEELREATNNKELFAQLGEMLAAPDEKGADKLNELYRKVISMPMRIDSMKKLADTLKLLVDLERRIYKIDDGTSNTAGDAVEALRKLAGGE